MLTILGLEGASHQTASVVRPEVLSDSFLWCQHLVSQTAPVKIFGPEPGRVLWRSLAIVPSSSISVQAMPSRLHTRNVVPVPRERIEHLTAGRRGQLQAPLDQPFVELRRVPRPALLAVARYPSEVEHVAGHPPRGSARLSPFSCRQDGTRMASGKSGASAHRSRSSGRWLLPRSWWLC